MTITSISSSTFIADTINLLRDKLTSNITDPINSSRVGNDKFVLTEYPQRPVMYPIITVSDMGSRQESRLGMQSEETAIRIGIELRIWARNVKERDELFDSIYDYLRDNQYTGDDITNANLHDFSVDNIINVSEKDVKSKIMEVSYLFICSWKGV